MGFLCFVLMQAALALFSGEGGRLMSGGAMDLVKGIGTMLWIFIPWFWLPFAIGILIGGFRLRRKQDLIAGGR